MIDYVVNGDGKSKRKNRMAEFSLQRVLWQYLFHVKKVFCWISYQPPGKPTGYQHRSSYGVADILGVYQGKPLAIEVKTKTGSASDNQKKFIKEFHAQGGIAFIARCTEDIDLYLFQGKEFDFKK